MAGAQQRKVKFEVVEGFKRRYQRFLPDAAVKKAMLDFNVAKRKIPPAPLDPKMRDHQLKGALAGISECHLAGDVLLLYTHKDDVVLLIDVCTHDELKEDSKSVVRKRVKVARQRLRVR